MNKKISIRNHFWLALVFICVFICNCFLLGSVAAQPEIEKPGFIETVLGIYVTTALVTEAGGTEDNVQLNDYFEGVFDDVMGTSVREGAFEWVILDSDDVNAVAAMGGFFVVTRGLLAFVQSDDELACALGHELGHFELAHGLSQLKREMAFLVGLTVLNIFLGDAETDTEAHREQAVRNAAEIVALLWKLKFSRDQERAADRLAVPHTLVAGYNPYACLDFMERLQNRSGDMSLLEVFVSTHPAFAERIDTMHASIQSVGYTEGRTHRTMTRPSIPTLQARGMTPARPALMPSLTQSQQAKLDEAITAMEEFSEDVESLDQEQAIAQFWERVEAPAQTGTD